MKATPKITVHRQTKVVEFAGHVGKFHTVIEEAGSKKTLDHGVVVLATGGSERLFYRLLAPAPWPYLACKRTQERTTR